MRFHYTVDLAGKQRLTKEGFLVCLDVPLARVGKMIYGIGETPIEPGPNGFVEVERTEDEVFHPLSLASINMKDVVDDHPTQDVCADTWRMTARGVVCGGGQMLAAEGDVITVNPPRRGAGDMKDFVIGDLLVKDRDTIQAIRDGRARGAAVVRQWQEHPVDQ